jgi:hypothetical protein
VSFNSRHHRIDVQGFLDENSRAGCALHIVVEREKTLRMEPSRGEGPFRILTMATNSDWVRLKLGDLLSFNVVLVSTGILGCQQHMDRLRDTLNHWLREEYGNVSGRLMSVRQKRLHECVDKWHQKDCFLKAALRSSPALLETMWWNRTQFSCTQSRALIYSKLGQQGYHCHQ